MTYHFKPLPELYWAVLTAVALVLLPTLVTLDPEKVTDWRVWAVALGGACIRAAAGAALDYVRRSVADQPLSKPEAIIEQIKALTPDERDALADELERLGKVA